jgi:hypothetical protein
MTMASERTPVDARAAKTMLRAYALAIPAATLIGGWCTLVQIAWIVFPVSVEPMPTAVKAAAAAGAGIWLLWLYRTFRRLPSLIDDILERGLALGLEEEEGSGQRWLGRVRRRP